MELSILAVGLGFLLDLLLGDPHWLYHPVRLVGHLITGLETVLRRIFPGTESGELAAGGCLLVLTAGITSASAWGLLFLAGLVHPYVRFALETVMCYQLLATKSLRDETMKVYTALRAGDVEGARRAVSMVVGRDTAVLDDIGITKAAVETVAENTSDGIIAPLLFMVIGGAPLGYFYKAVNTMDSMVGYKNDRYREFGTCAARLDDVANLLPARLGAMLMLLAGSMLGYDAAGGWRIWLRDRYAHKSPNSAQSESVLAGLLGLRLGGPAYYFGKLVVKPTIGDERRAPQLADYDKACRVLNWSVILAAVIFSFCYLWSKI